MQNIKPENYETEILVKENKRSGLLNNGNNPFKKNLKFELAVCLRSLFSYH